MFFAFSPTLSRHSESSFQHQDAWALWIRQRSHALKTAACPGRERLSLTSSTSTDTLGDSQTAFSEADDCPASGSSVSQKKHKELSVSKSGEVYTDSCLMDRSDGNVDKGYYYYCYFFFGLWPLQNIARLTSLIWGILPDLLPSRYL